MSIRLAVASNKGLFLRGNFVMITNKQFDLSHHKVAEHLQGVALATFTRRSIAYGVDWAVITILTTLFWLFIPIGIFLLLIKQKVIATSKKGTALIQENLLQIDEKLASMEVGQSIRHRFKKHMSVYLQLVIYVPIVAAFAVLGAVIYGLVAPDSYGQTEQWFDNAYNASLLSTTVDGFGWLFKLLSALLYFTFFTWKWHGQTPGKRLMRIKVAKLDGSEISLLNSFERFSGYTASAALLLYGFFQFFWEKNHQTTHDKIVETVVIKA